MVDQEVDSELSLGGRGLGHCVAVWAGVIQNKFLLNPVKPSFE